MTRCDIWPPMPRRFCDVLAPARCGALMGWRAGEVAGRKLCRPLPHPGDAPLFAFWWAGTTHRIAHLGRKCRGSRSVPQARAARGAQTARSRALPAKRPTAPPQDFWLWEGPSNDVRGPS